MYYGGVGGYNPVYVDTMSLGRGRPYYNQPTAIMGPTATTVTVIDGNRGYGYGRRRYANEAESACLTCLCLQVLC